ncbi:MAG: toll/interleukin-1 receptor domain-containing protein [Bacteroidota bacterium]
MDNKIINSLKEDNTNIKSRIPKVFISYSWDDKTHKKWVKDLAKRLRSDGVETILDQWHTVPGDQMPEFMEKAIRKNDFVLIVCTPRYKRKSDNREGGVGYEGDIMTAEVLTTKNHRKFIPILRGEEWSSSSPSWLSGASYIDLQGNPYDQEEYNELCATFHNRREEPPPVSRKKLKNEGNKSSQLRKEQTEKISFDLSNPLLWNVSDGRYTATGSEDTFAWSEKVFEGDVTIDVSIESNHENGEGVIIVYGDGINWSRGCLVFNITPNSQSIRAHNVYEGGQLLRETHKHIEFKNHIFAMKIEIIDDKAALYVDGEKIASTFLPPDIKKKGRIALHKYWERPEVTYSNIAIIENNDLPLLPIKSEIRIEITRITYQSIKNDNNAGIAIITLNPNRYNLEANILYLKGKKNTVTNILLIIQNKLTLQPRKFTPFALEEGEMKQIDISFPVEDKDAPNALKEGFFELQLTDIYGNKYSSKGDFPIK